nr:MAG TPA: hypothetical protein [Caudoviricetes sp.]
MMVIRIRVWKFHRPRYFLPPQNLWITGINFISKDEPQSTKHVDDFFLVRPVHLHRNGRILRVWGGHLIGGDIQPHKQARRVHRHFRINRSIKTLPQCRLKNLNRSNKQCYLPLKCFQQRIIPGIDNHGARRIREDDGAVTTAALAAANFCFPPEATARTSGDTGC